MPDKQPVKKQTDEEWNAAADQALASRPPAPPATQIAKAPDALQGTVRSAKPRKAVKLRVTMYSEGIKPYPMDVIVKENGTFTIDNRTYIIAPGSVWQEAGRYRTIANDRNPLTIHVASLTGDDMVTPEVINGIANNNLWEQQDNYGKRRSKWKEPGTWIAGAALFVAIGLGLFAILSMNDSLDGIRDAIDRLEVIIQNAAGSNSSGGAGSGHNDIAPEG